MLVAHRRPLPLTDARRILAASQAHADTHAGVALLLLVGCRMPEIEAVRPGHVTAGPRLRTGVGPLVRSIRIAPSAGAAVETYLAAAEAGAVLRLRGPRLISLVRGTTASLGVDAGVPELWASGVMEVQRRGVPRAWVARYFGLSGARGRQDLSGLTAVPEGYDAEIAALLQDAFA